MASSYVEHHTVEIGMPRIAAGESVLSRRRWLTCHLHRWRTVVLLAADRVLDEAMVLQPPFAESQLGTNESTIGMLSTMR